MRVKENGGRTRRRVAKFVEARDRRRGSLFFQEYACKVSDNQCKRGKLDKIEKPARAILIS